ncbi:hypothetical protein [Quadrisphaera granulorum]|uniref:hypothetical protein n=1 Tax=Quadrisphaera granulorum TaxID=317664 RepID=UPI000D6C9237|nr:hypothetical protein [Quadrisphaera granulorum]
MLGREEELAALVRTVSSCRLVTLTGPAGIGKTHLACTASSRGLLGGPGPVLVVGQDTAGQGVDDQDIVGRTAEALADRVPGRWDVVLLDGADTEPTSAREAASLVLRHDTALRVLVTSRVPLGLPGEQLLPVGPLAVPGREASLVEALTSPAARLVLERLEAREPALAVHLREAAQDGQPGRDDLEALLELVRLLDGSPLALELAAGWLRSLTPQEALDRWQRGLPLPAPRKGPALARHRSIEAALAGSLAALSHPARRVLGLMAVTARPLDFAAVEALVAGDDDDELDDDELLDALDELVDGSLVHAEAHGTITRYRVPGPHQFVARAFTDGDEETARSRLEVHLATRSLNQLRRVDRVERVPMRNAPPPGGNVAGRDAPECLGPGAGVVARLARTSDGWLVTWRGQSVELPPSKGMDDLVVLLGAPGVPVSAAALRDGRPEMPVGTADAGTTNALTARHDALRARSVELRAALDAADRRGDVEESRAAAEELLQLGQHLAAGRWDSSTITDSDDAAALERARSAVGWRVRQVLRLLRDRHPELEEHLRACLRLGTVCCYAPSPPVVWEVAR